MVFCLLQKYSYIDLCTNPLSRQFPFPLQSQEDGFTPSFSIFCFIRNVPSEMVGPKISYQNRNRFNER
ncbi:hypothetical protein C0J52_22779 [Blattella germanica]|nr:hypothetical protein C0J52_22779 [Blattella germanica]